MRFCYAFCLLSATSYRCLCGCNHWHILSKILPCEVWEWPVFCLLIFVLCAVITFTLASFTPNCKCTMIKCIQLYNTGKMHLTSHFKDGFGDLERMQQARMRFCLVSFHPQCWHTCVFVFTDDIVDIYHYVETWGAQSSLKNSTNCHRKNNPTLLYCHVPEPENSFEERPPSSPMWACPDGRLGWQ